MAVVLVAGVIKCHDLTANQLADIQQVAAQSSWDFSNFADPIHVYARNPGTALVGGVRKQAWGSWDVTGRVIELWPQLSRIQFRYTFLHEIGHAVNSDFLDPITRRDLMDNFMLPVVPSTTGWKDGDEYHRPSEGFAHQFAVRLYVGTGDWGNVLSGGKTDLDGYYRHYFQTSDVSAVASVVETSVGDGDPGPPDTGDPGAVELDTLRDVALRKKVGGTTTQGAGLEQHIPLGFIGDTTDNVSDWKHTGLIEFDLSGLPDDVDTITSAVMEMTVTADQLDPHLSISGAKSVLQAAMVLTTWTEGTHGEGDWNAADFRDPTWEATIKTLGPVDQKVRGTRLSYDVLNYVAKWAPKTVKVQGFGAGQAKPNYGLYLRMSDMTKIAGATVFASGENPTTAWRPTLFITYQPTALPPVAFPQTPVGSLSTNDFEFSAEYSDPLGQDHLGAYRLQVRKVSNGDDVWVTGEIPADANSQATGVFLKSSLDAPAGTFKTGVDYEWRTQVQSANSRLWSDWTDWTTFTITSAAPIVSASSLGSLATLDNVYFGGPFTDPLGGTTTGTPPPLTFPRMSIWWAWGTWQNADTARVATAINDLTYMHMDGVVLQGKEWGAAHDCLPSQIDTMLDMFIAAGIKPYVALWMGKFDATDRAAGLEAWNAGNGKWAGVIIDAEAGWVDYHASAPATANANVTTFIGQLRSAGATQVVYHGYGDPDYWDSGDHDYNWELWNSLCDIVMPHADTPNTLDGATRRVNKYFRAFQEHDAVWTNHLPPLVWLHNGYSINADPVVRRYVVERALQEQGAVSLWQYQIQNSQVRDVLHSIPPLATTNVYRIINMRIQLRNVPQGDPAWDTDDGLLWDTGEQALTEDEKTLGQVRRLYSGQGLPAGDYTYRVEVQNSAGAWSTWSYGTLTLTVGFEVDPGAFDFLSGYARKKLDRRIVIRDMTADRGPGDVKAIIYDAANIGCSMVANDTGEFYFTIPTTHPQASEIEPLQRHYAMEFYRAGNWRPLFEGVITDMDATEDDVVFYGLDYMGLLSKSVETAFYDWDSPDASIDAGGAKYIDKAISYVIKDQLQRGHDDTDSPIGFIDVEGQGASILMEAVPAHVSINAAFRERLAFILGLIQSAKQGTGNRSRLWPEHAADGSFRWRFKNNAGTQRDNLRLKYGELVQGFRVVLLGNSWAAKVYGAGRITNEVKLRFKSASAPGIDTSIWGNVAMPALWQDLIDENDLQRRVKQLAMEAGKFGKNVALGLRVHGLEPLDGFDLMDTIPVTIQRGAVDTTRYGSGYWTIQGIEWRLFPDGHDETTLAVKPREDTVAPDPDLIPSHPISTAPEWSRAGIIGAGLTVTTETSLRDDGTVTATAMVSATPLDVEGYGYSVLQVVPNADAGVSDFSTAITVPYTDPSVTLLDLLPNQEYSVRVGAYDTGGNFSGWSSSVIFNATKDTEAPATPAGLSVSGALGGLSISWTTVGAPDLDRYEVSYLTGSTEVITSTKGTAIAITGLPANMSYDVKVRALDTTGNASAWSSVVNAVTRLVETPDVGELDASVITTGVLNIGGTDSPTLEVFNGSGQLIFRVDNTGILAINPDNTDEQMLFEDGTLLFTDDNWATSGVAISGKGIRANAITEGSVPGGHNMIPNSSFENTPFSTPSTHLWTLAADWGTTIGTDVGVDKSTGQLKMTAVTY